LQWELLPGTLPPDNLSGVAVALLYPVGEFGSPVHDSALDLGGVIGGCAIEI
jgi:hypothetical protein